MSRITGPGRPGEYGEGVRPVERIVPTSSARGYDAERDRKGEQPEVHAVFTSSIPDDGRERRIFRRFAGYDMEAMKGKEGPQIQYAVLTEEEAEREGLKWDKGEKYLSGTQTA